MAVLEKIRVRFGLAISIIIALALLSFIIDPGTLQSAMQGMSSKYDVGKIAGRAVRYTDYQEDIALGVKRDGNLLCLLDHKLVAVRQVLKGFALDGANGGAGKIRERPDEFFIRGDRGRSIVPYIGHNIPSRIQIHNDVPEGIKDAGAKFKGAVIEKNLTAKIHAFLVEEVEVRVIVEVRERIIVVVKGTRLL